MARNRLCLLLVRLSIPYDGCMCSQREPEANYIRKEKQNSSKPAVRPYSFDEEAVIDGRRLGVIASSAIAVRNSYVCDNTCMTIEFMLSTVSKDCL